MSKQDDMPEAAKDSAKQRMEHLKLKVYIKELQLGALLDITNSINRDFSTSDLLDKYRSFLKDQLMIGKLALYSRHQEWKCILSYGFKRAELSSIDVERDLLHMKEITSVAAEQRSALANFDLVIPVYHDTQALAYLLLADQNNEEMKVSRLIKHLNFLQLLTNIIVTAIEKQRLAEAVHRQEKEKLELAEKQNEILEQIVQQRTRELQAEKDQSDRLLYNILPEELAEELKHSGATTPMRYEDATVIFTDFKDFTESSTNIPPKRLVNELNEIFQAFDFITEKYSIEKIKTIGDAYMAVSGLPRKSEYHAILAVRAALDMIRFISGRKAKKQFRWKMRVGIHSGQLVAGVVGTKKFIYDVWGNTVNIASRMESCGMTGKVNISGKTFEKIKEHFECHYRGRKEVKGKGKMKMYFVEREKESPRYRKVKQFILKKLERELPDNLFYHGLHHTIDVCDVAAGIALREGMSPEETELIKVAALFHDSGFIKQYDENEIVGCKIARQYLPKFGFEREEIRKINRMITATHTPQRPHNRMEEILADADLDYFGRADFEPIAATLFRELNANGKYISEAGWRQKQIEYLKNHRFFTKTAQETRNKGKQKQLEKLLAGNATGTAASTANGNGRPSQAADELVPRSKKKAQTEKKPGTPKTKHK
jgi:class 3 adenylate cyclase/predicted metal-dependent HD superfamily phosphohydrolase